MFRMSDMIGLPVIQAGEVKFIGSVKSVLMDKKNNAVVAVVCKRSILRDFIEIISYRKIKKIDMNHVIIDKDEIFQRINHFSSITEYKAYEDIIDNLIINQHGDVLGMVTDIYFNEKDGHITAYEITEGYIDDILSGRKMIHFQSDYHFIPNYEYKPYIENSFIYKP